MTTVHGPQTTMEDQLCRVPTPQSKTYLAGLWSPMSLPLECVACAGGCVVVIERGLRWSPGYTDSRASWEVQAKVIHHLCSACGHPALSYNTIYRWLLPVLGLEMPKQGQCWLLLVPGLAPLGDRYRAC